jgi:hypothetical protein
MKERNIPFTELMRCPLLDDAEIKRFDRLWRLSRDSGPSFRAPDKTASAFAGKCFRCGLKGHTQQNCRVQNSKARRSDKSGHGKSKHNWKKGKKDNKKTSKQCSDSLYVVDLPLLIRPLVRVYGLLNYGGRWAWTPAAMLALGPPTDILSWCVQYSDNFVGKTEFGRQVSLDSALSILLHSLDFDESSLIPAFTHGCTDCLCEDPNVGMVTVLGKGRPVAGRLSLFADRYTDPWLADQLRLGYDWKLPDSSTGISWIQNSNACCEHLEFVNQELQSWLAMGAIHVYSRAIFDKYGPPICVSPLHVASDGKLRLILDGRVPNHIDHDGSVRYESLELSLLPFLADGELLGKTDVRSGYFHIPTRECDAPYLALSWNGLLFYTTSLTFGRQSACWFFEKVMAPLRAALRAQALLFIGYLDDQAHALGSDSLSIASPEWQRRLSMIIYFGWALCCLKTEGPSHELEVLGLHLNTVERMVHLTQRRCQKLLDLLAELAHLPAGSKIPAKTVARFAGYLVSAEPAVWGALRLAYPFLDCIKHIQESQHWFAKVTLSERAMCALSLIPEWWSWAHGKPYPLPRATASIAGDSSLYAMGGAFSLSDCPPLLVGSVPDSQTHWAPWDDDGSSPIAGKELFNMVQLCHRFTDRVAGSFLELWVDNQNAFHYLRKGGGRIPHWASLAWDLTLWLLSTHTRIVRVSWVPTELNCLADDISRQVHAEPWMLHPKLFSWVIKKAVCHGLPEPTIDAFASAADALLPRFIARFYCPGAVGVNFYAFHFDSCEVLWCHPPWAMLVKVLAHIALHSLRAFVLIPLWHDAPWFALFRGAAWKLVLPNTGHTFLLGSRSGDFIQRLPYHVAVFYVG